MQPNHIRIQIAGSEEDYLDVRLDEFIKKMNAVKHALTEIDRLITKGKSSYYRVTDLVHSSPAAIELAIVPRQDKQDRTALIVETFYSGLRMIQESRQAPEIFDGQALRAFRELAPAPNEQITSLRIFRNGDSVSVHSTLAANIDSILGPDLYENGSVSGRLEQINIHGDSNIFTIYPTLGGYKLRCVFPKGIRTLAVNALDKYVTIYGRMKFKNRDTYAYEMIVRDIEIHEQMDTLPTLGELRGIAPDATGGMKSEDFVRKLRDEWE